MFHVMMLTLWGAGVAWLPDLPFPTLSGPSRLPPAAGRSQAFCPSSNMYPESGNWCSTAKQRVWHAALSHLGCMPAGLG